jgi:hypothetical protein
MNPWTANAPVFSQLDLSYPMQSPLVSQQAYGLHGSPMAPHDVSLQTLPTDGHVTTGQSSMSQSFHPSPALHIHASHNAESFDDTPNIPPTSMGPPTKSRKRKAPTLRADAWEPYKARVVELHIMQKLPLPEVKKTIEEEFGFTAEYVSPSTLSAGNLWCSRTTTLTL